ncbi:MAG TPA: hypothetical protein VEB63_04825 [Chitinophagaceae bacterium]|nr:hypothetical protein [Chitinophagaceae bacterium]
MKVLLTIVCSLLAVASHAQEDSWTVRLNGRVLLHTSVEGRVLKVTSSQWKRSGRLEIRYHDAQKHFWIRSFQLHDEGDNMIFSADSLQRLNISLAKLRRLFAGKKELRVYTVVRPADPTIAVRIRRVHLCTLRLP